MAKGGHGGLSCGLKACSQRYMTCMDGLEQVSECKWEMWERSKDLCMV